MNNMQRPSFEEVRSRRAVYEHSFVVVRSMRQSDPIRRRSFGNQPSMLSTGDAKTRCVVFETDFSFNRSRFGVRANGMDG